MYSGSSPVWFKSCVFINSVNYFYQLIHLFIVLFDPLHLVYFGDGSLRVIFISDFWEISRPRPI